MKYGYYNKNVRISTIYALGDDVMTTTFSKKVKLLSVSMSKVKAESDLDRKVLAAEEMLGHARELGTHTARYARIAWVLDMMLLLPAVLSFFTIILILVLEDIIPPEIYQPIYSGLDTMNPDVFFLMTVGPFLLPPVFDAILAAVCKHSPVAAGKTAGEVKTRTPEKRGYMEDAVWKKMSRVRDALDNVQNELNPAHTLPVRISRVLCFFSLIPLAVMLYAQAVKEGIPKATDLIVWIFAYTATFLLFLGCLWLILWLKLCVLKLFFSSWTSRRQAKKLRKEFSSHWSEYSARYNAQEQQRKAKEQEQKRLSDLKEGAELYRKATMGRTIDERLMAQAAEKGDPQAGLYVGKQILKRVEAGGYTRRESKELCEKAQRYLMGAGIPDADLLYALAQLHAEWHDEDGWTNILRRVRGINKMKLSRECRAMYDDIVERLVDKADSARSAATPSISDVARRLGGGGSGSYSSSYSIHDDLDAVQRAMEISRTHGEDWKGYDPESFSSSDL